MHVMDYLTIVSQSSNHWLNKLIIENSELSIIHHLVIDRVGGKCKSTRRSVM